MEPNEILNRHFNSIVDNQIKTNNPPVTKETFQRLLAEGFSTKEAKNMIGQCVVVEMFKVVKSDEVFDESRFAKNLSKLPEEPFDD
jgi:hypothetical protein